MIDSKLILKTATVATAIATLATMAWGFGDYTGTRPILKNEFDKSVKLAQTNQATLESQLQQTQQATETKLDEITKLMAIQRFSSLELKRELGNLDFLEMQERCALASTLEYTVIVGCRK